MKSLLKQEQKAIVSPNVLVAVGYGACLDIFVDAADLLGEEKQPNEPNHADEIKTKKDLLETFAYFFSHGAAAEYDSSLTLLFSIFREMSFIIYHYIL